MLAPLENPSANNLLPRLIRWVIFSQLALAAMLLLPGGLHFWQGWAFMAVNLVVTVFFCAYFYRRDPEFLARRLFRRENVGVQRFIIFLIRNFSAVAFIFCGLDHRHGWSQRFFAPVPAWLTLLALAGYVGSYIFMIYVFNCNRYAANIIRVEVAQPVCERGPYRRVRHPMYSASLLLWICTSPALGSFLALAVVAPMSLVIAWRLLDEEKFLKRELPGYAEYCARTPCRLVPGVW